MATAASGFWAAPKVESVLEQHAADLSSLQDDEIKRMLKLYKSARQDLRDRLDVIPSGTFTAQKMNGALVQIESGIRQMNDVLKREMSTSGRQAAELGIEQLVDEIKSFEREFTGAVIPISIDAANIATDTSNFLFNKYDASIDAYSAGLRSVFAQQLAQAVVEEIPMGEVVSRVSKYFMGEEWRMQRLVRTEMMGVYSLGKLNGMKKLRDDDIPDLMKTLYHPMDKRTGEDTKRLAKRNPVVPIDEPFVESSTGHKLTYMAPPNRPNDRAILIPYREAWGD